MSIRSTKNGKTIRSRQIHSATLLAPTIRGIKQQFQGLELKTGKNVIVGLRLQPGIAKHLKRGHTPGYIYQLWPKRSHRVNTSNLPVIASNLIFRKAKNCLKRGLSGKYLRFGMRLRGTEPEPMLSRSTCWLPLKIWYAPSICKSKV